ncbi:MAG: hypothetical protein JO310_03190 [Hyphomicrobiales bacterium]|nr:hypothetical protein [Hyphomicrobiales bacterium]
MRLVDARDTPSPPEEVIFPALLTVQDVPEAPLIPFAPEAVDVTVPVLVTYRGLLAVPSDTGPTTLVLIVLPFDGTAMVKLSAPEGAELGPPAAACVAVAEWLALLNGAVGVKLQLPLATVVVPATVPSIDTVTVSPVTPLPEIVGSAVLVMVLPFVGVVMLGAEGVPAAVVMKVPLAPSLVAWKPVLPSVDVWKERSAVWLPFETCSTPVEVL